MTAPAHGSAPISKATWMALGAFGVCALLSNTVLFRQEVQGLTDLTSRIAPQVGRWTEVAETPATKSEIQGLETRDIIKRSYSDGTHEVQLVVAYIAHSSRKSAHAQEACLRGAGAMVSRIETRRLKKAPVRAKSITLDFMNQRQLVYYWYKIGHSHSSDYLSASLKLFLAGIMGKHSQGATLVRLLTPIDPGENPMTADERLEDFTAAVLPELELKLP